MEVEAIGIEKVFSMAMKNEDKKSRHNLEEDLSLTDEMKGQRLRERSAQRTLSLQVSWPQSTEAAYAPLLLCSCSSDVQTAAKDLTYFTASVHLLLGN